MDHEQVRQLEDAIDAAIAYVLGKHVPGPPLTPKTTHLMAKAAVAVLEAVAEKSPATPPLPADR
jgi:hypothetical protein